MSTEPSRIIGLISALVTAIGGALVAFGIDWSEEQQNAIIGVVVAVVPVIILTAEFIRGRVWSKESVDTLVATAKEAGATGSPAPPVVP